MKTAAEIYSEMCTAYEEETGVELNNVCDMAVRMRAFSEQLYSLYLYNDWVKKQCFPQTAEGEYLDNHAELRGLVREGPKKAEGRITFSIPTAIGHSITIPRGTVCMTENGTSFETTRPSLLTTGSTSCTVDAQATEGGTSGNVNADTIIYMAVPPVGISSCTNASSFTGGKDEESDDELRERIIRSFGKLTNGANAAYYEKAALEVPGVRSARVLPRERGAGTVDVVITSDNGIPQQALIDSVQQVMDEKREICTDVEVVAPDQVDINIAAKIDIKDGYTLESVAQNVEDSIFEYFFKECLGENILVAKLGDLIFNSEGVKNYKITTPSADISIEPNELPVLMSIGISRMGQ